MSYAIIRNANHKMNAVPLLERHNEHRNKNYSNKEIDLSRSSENYHLKSIQAETYQKEFERIRQRHNLKGNLRLSGEKQSNVMCEFVITSDKNFFERLGEELTRRFFEDAYKFVTAKVGENFVVSAVVHMDEATPHMHVTYIPVINTDRLFTKDNGEPQHPNTTYTWLKRFCERNNFPFYGIHQFRHFFASILVNEGVDIVSVSGALGHSTVATTSGIYCHLLENARARVSDAITNALKFGA